MAIPLIYPQQSVLGFLQNEPFKFQAFATNTPTGWTSSSLPPGVSLNAFTGLVSGPCTAAGVYNFDLVAINVDGPSLPVVFAMGIKSTFSLAASSFVELLFDIATNQVTVQNPLVFDGLKDSDEFKSKPVPIALFAKYNDVRIFKIKLVREGVGLELPITKCRLGMRDLDSDVNLIQTDGVMGTSWKHEGAGADYLLTLAAQYTGDDLKAKLADHEDDVMTYFIGLSEIELEYTNSSGVGPGTARITSQTFGTLFMRDLVQNT